MRRLFVIALVIAFGCKGKAPSGDHGAVSGDAVVGRLKAALTAALPDVKLSMTADDRMIVGVGSGSSSLELSLDNLRRSCASSEGECTSAIAGVVENTKKGAVTLETDAGPPDKSTIRLTPKTTDWLQQADDRTKKFADKIVENTLPRTKFVGDLWWLYVYDEPSGMRMINNKDMQGLGMTVEQLHAFAVANLAAQYPKLELSELTPGMWTVEPGDYLDSARLALTDQWRAEAKQRGGKLTVSVPARSRVFVMNDPKLREGFDKITAKAFTEEDHPLSQMTLVWTDTGWAAGSAVAAPSGDDPVLAAMTAFRDRTCACKDEPCLDAVRDDMNKFSNDQAMNPAVSPVSDARNKQMADVGKQLTDCMVKVMSKP